jgi:hypothetical protein
MDTFFSIEDVRTSQSSLAPSIFSKVLMNFDTIIEIGTWTGAFTKWISENVKPECKIISFDINSDYREFQKHDRKIDRTTFVIGDVFSDENIEIIKGLIRKKDKRVLVLCDGGLKEKEFSIFSKFLKINDVIMLHDYSESEEEYNRISAEINWPTPSESHYENIKNDVINNGLDPYLYKDFKGVLWGSFIKIRPKLSVIVPAYEFSRFIEINLITILNQKTNFDFEVIVRDDFSEDGSDKILSRLENMFPNLIVHKATENWGAHKNIKFLLEQASGEYIAYLDGDDYYVDPYKLQKQVDFLDQNLNYVMHGTGYCILRGENEYIPGDGQTTFWAPIEIVKTEDLFEQNYVGFGRVFRNIKGIYKDYMNDLPYLDYAINYELSLFGLIKNENWYGGVYREHFGGTLTSLSDDEKEKTHNMMKNILKNRHENYKKMKNKPIAIIDCFINSKKIEGKLKNCVQNLKKYKHDVLLISNSIISEEILNLVDYYVYDKENRLFSDGDYNADPITLYKIYDNIEIYEIVSGVQRHGLSVMRNLFKAIKIAKEYGYTHFHRVEVDDIMGDISLDNMTLIPRLGVDGIFYFNENDISFHYMYCSIDYFLNNIREINAEEDYYDYLKNEMQSSSFRNVEEFVRHNLNNSDLTNIKTLKGSDMNKDFPDTIWNTEVSSSNIDSKYKNCTTSLYKVFDTEGNQKDSIAILSYNYSESTCERRIEIVYNSGVIKEIYHKVNGKGFWSYDLISNLIEKILVFEGEELLYFETAENIQSHIILK